MTQGTETLAPIANSPDFAFKLSPDPDFESLCAADDFILKEHFENFRARFSPTTSKQTTGRSFNRLIDNVYKPFVRGSYSGSFTRPSVDPTPFPGLRVFSRCDLDITPYPGNASDTSYRSIHLAGFAIQVGSLVAIKPIVEMHMEGPKVQQFTLDLIAQLAQQI